MASSLTIQVGAVTGVRTFGIADAKVAATLRRFASARGLDVGSLSNQQLANAVAAEIAEMVRQAAISQQIADGQTAQLVTLAATAAVDNAL